MNKLTAQGLAEERPSGVSRITKRRFMMGFMGNGQLATGGS